MFQVKAFVCKRRPIDACRSSPVAVEEVPTLNHEVFDDAMELAAFVALRSAEVILGLASAVLTEVLCSAWYLSREKLHLDAAERFATKRNVKEDNWILLSHAAV